MKTYLISGFPGVGKSHFYKKSNLKVLDSDSSKFDKSDFPANYIKHIKENLGKVNVILISSHIEVREALDKANLEFFIVYPNKQLKKEYIERYRSRGNLESFIELLDDNWDIWLNQIYKIPSFFKIELQAGQYLSDVL